MKSVITIFLFLIFISCNEGKSKSGSINIPNYEDLQANDIKLGIPKDGDWLKQHEEKEETFAQYITKKPLVIKDKRKVIYLQPIGTFTDEEDKMLKLTTEYVGYFFGLRTVLLESVSADDFPTDKKRIQFGTEQLNASYIISSILPQRIPPDGIVIMGLTARDLYPYDSWNYVFGLASYSQHTAVTSMYRFKDSDFESGNYSLCLNRLIKTATHEISHMFTIPHCIHGECLMNGANHIVELDNQPNTLCSVCLAKLSWNLNFDNLKRMEQMISFFKKHKLEADAVALQRQLEILKE